MLLSWLDWGGVVFILAFLVALAIHELGHSACAAFFGVHADEVVIGPVGNLRGPHFAQRPFEGLCVLLAGPLSNLVMAASLIPFLHAFGMLDLETWNPLSIRSVWRGPEDLGCYLALAFKAQYILLIVNLLPMYPLDGGRILRDLLSLRINPFYATLLAVGVGGLGSVVLFSVGLWFHYLWVAALAGYVLLLCVRRHRELEYIAEAHENEFGYDFSEGYTSLEKSMSHGQTPGPHQPTLTKSVQHWLEERRRKKTEDLEAELDRILAKIHDAGMESLSRSERRILEEASRRRRHE
jgi:Zn-dependent protease